MELHTLTWATHSYVLMTVYTDRAELWECKGGADCSFLKGLHYSHCLISEILHAVTQETSGEQTVGEGSDWL